MAERRVETRLADVRQERAGETAAHASVADTSEGGVKRVANSSALYAWMKS